MGIEGIDSFLPNMILELHSEEHGPKRLARVIYCQQRGTVYRIGLEFIAESGQAS
jgi:hypothetical protein